MTGGETEPIPAVETGPAVDVQPVEPARSGAHAAPRRRRRRIRTAVALTVLTLTGAGVAVVAPWKSGSDTATTEPGPRSRTTKVIRTDLTDTRILDGVLGYGTPRTVNGIGNGTVTWLAASGTKVSRGEPLYRVDDRPVTVLYGSVPMYRRLEVPNTVGRDVRVIADNLRALGYEIGPQPVPGQTVTGPIPSTGTAGPGGERDAAVGKSSSETEERPSTGPSGPPASGTGSSERGTRPGRDSGSGTSTEQRLATGPVKVRSDDGVLTESLINAIKRWQTSLGVPTTGVIEPGDVVVFRDAVRVEGADLQPGDPAEGGLLRVTSTTRAVTVDINAGEVGDVQRGDAVNVRLPGGESAVAEVASISRSAKGGSEPGLPGELRVTVTVTFKDPGKAGRFHSAPVQVEFGSATRAGVLAVPLTALLALREGGYGLQRADGTLVAVRTGLIAKGMVEISGDGIAEGVRVVTAS
ncbi:peptidoglycan-binding protein [Streptomyces marokkonensis]|uniref:Peptidoglycan-binding protein n=1 Tax=Streptomyces marokkonensis TaxID=324855 RepID=A0ABW6QE87_9ACTN